MKVVAFYADTTGNGWYRIMWPARAVNACTDWQVETLGHWPNRVEAHVVVFQRPLRARHLQILRTLRDAGCAIVIDMDDDVLHFPPGHKLQHQLPRWHPEQECTQVALEACELADLVTVPTPALAELYAPHGRVEILPNCIPADRLSAGLDMRRARTGPPTVGYRGAVTGFKELDVAEVGSGVRWAQEAADFDFLGVGGHDVTKRMRVRGTNVLWADMHDLGPHGYTAYLARIDVGLVPLRRCLFNEGKSDLAALEHAAMGTPVVASPTGPYLELERQGVCTTARTSAQWRDAILAALEHTDRQDLVDYAAGRTFELNAWRWCEAWAKARAHRG